MNSAFNVLCHTIAKFDFNHKVEEDRQAVVLDFGEPSGMCLIAVEGDRLSIYAPLEIEVPEYQAAHVMEAVLRMNTLLELGRLDMDLDTNELQCVLVTHLPGGFLDEQAAGHLIAHFLLMMVWCEKVLAAVVDDNVAPVDAIQQVRTRLHSPADEDILPS
ncbi:MAG: hypothetical protein ACAI35_16125 [Candidatus Methylacidiphilales bacterium]|nr:hypothetical protein [Candidatus Methylacidiphilales bacterium]